MAHVVSGKLWNYNSSVKVNIPSNTYYTQIPQNVSIPQSVIKNWLSIEAKPFYKRKDGMDCSKQKSADITKVHNSEKIQVEGIWEVFSRMV